MPYNNLIPKLFIFQRLQLANVNSIKDVWNSSSTQFTCREQHSLQDCCFGDRRRIRQCRRHSKSSHGSCKHSRTRILDGSVVRTVRAESQVRPGCHSNSIRFGCSLHRWLKQSRGGGGPLPVRRRTRLRASFLSCWEVVRESEVETLEQLMVLSVHFVVPGFYTPDPLVYSQWQLDSARAHAGPQGARQRQRGISLPAWARPPGFLLGNPPPSH